MLIMKNYSYVCVHVRASLSLHTHHWSTSVQTDLHPHPCDHQQQRDVPPQKKKKMLRGNEELKIL